MRGINWKYGGESGFWASNEQRFEISPRFFGRERPVDYELTDRVHKTKRIFDTVAECKSAATSVASKDSEQRG